MAAVTYPPGIHDQRTVVRQVRNIATKGKPDATACSRDGIRADEPGAAFLLAAGRPLPFCHSFFSSSRRRTYRAYSSPDLRASLFSSFGVASHTGILSARPDCRSYLPLYLRQARQGPPYPPKTSSREGHAYCVLLPGTKKQGGMLLPVRTVPSSVPPRPARRSVCQP